MRTEKEIHERVQKDLQFITAAVTSELHDLAYLEYFTAWENNGGMGGFFHECVDITNEIMLSEGSEYLKWLNYWKTTEGNNWECFSEYTDTDCFDWYHMTEAVKLFKSKYKKDKCINKQMSEHIGYYLTKVKSEADRSYVLLDAVNHCNEMIESIERNEKIKNLHTILNILDKGSDLHTTMLEAIEKFKTK